MIVSLIPSFPESRFAEDGGREESVFADKWTDRYMPLCRNFDEPVEDPKILEVEEKADE